MSKLRIKLTVLFIALIAFSVLAAGLLMGYSYKRNNLEALKEHMIRELRLMNDTVDPQAEALFAGGGGLLQDKAAKYEAITGMRVTYIATDGTVLADSEQDPAAMDNHRDRAEIREASAVGTGSSIRHSETLDQNMLYVAIPVLPAADGAAPLGFIRLAASLGEVERSLNNLYLALVGGLLLLVLVAAGISYRVALSVSKPLERMTAAAKRMAGMDYATRVPDKGRDEVGELARALNAMAASLQEQLNEIRRNGTSLQAVLDNMPSGVVMIAHDGRITLFNRQAEILLGSSAGERIGRMFTDIRQHYELVGFIRDGLASGEALDEELTIYYPEERLLELHLVPMTLSGDEAEPGLLAVMQDVTAIRRLERMRSEFVANVSHELKTPVAAVKGFAETLLSGAMNDPETAAAFLKIIHDESDRLNRLIGDILELSKIESRRSPVQFSPVELTPFLQRMAEVLSVDAAKKQIELDVVSEEGLFIEADEDRLGQIVMNLLQNGINYTPEGGKVRVRAELVAQPPADAEPGEQEIVRITVSDTGIGIPKKDIPRIFERFYRVDKARSRSSGGTGLGLSIVKHLVELHHGTIRVESTPGVGSQFILELPLIQT